MSIQNYNLPTQNSLNTFNGVNFTLPTGDSFDLTGSFIKIDFVTPSTSTKPLLTMTTLNGKITINSLYEFSIAEQKILLPKGTYYWDCKIRFADGREKTYIGGNWIIEDVITE